MPPLDAWRPLAPEVIAAVVAPFDNWWLCGGLSVDWLVGRVTREHGDTDVGVFRSEVEQCLAAIGQDRVFLADPPGELRAWDGGAVPEHVNDFWILAVDRQAWVLQIMVYTDTGEEGQEVVYKRNSGIRWSKSAHTVNVRGMRVLNPAITMLFKAGRSDPAPKDRHDLRLLIEWSKDRWTR